MLQSIPRFFYLPIAFRFGVTHGPCQCQSTRSHGNDHSGSSSLRESSRRKVDRTIVSALDDLHQERKVKAVVLTGAGANFCCGLDLHELHSYTQLDELEAMPMWILSWQRLAELIEKMLRFPKPIVAAVDGQAAGAGLSLALASDLVVATETATFSAPTVQQGIVPGVLAPLATHRLGAAVASRLLFTSQSFCAAEAQQQGWVAQVVKSDQFGWPQTNARIDVRWLHSKRFPRSSDCSTKPSLSSFSPSYRLALPQRLQSRRLKLVWRE